MTTELIQVPHIKRPLQRAHTLGNKLTRTISWVYAFALFSVLVGSAFGLYQNWLVRMDDATERLIKTASMANFLVETALSNAEKSLEITHKALKLEWERGKPSPEKISQILDQSFSTFSEYNNVELFGLLLYIDADGMLFAQSGGNKKSPIDFSDRYYFTQLRDHPHLKKVIGPLVHARTTGKWAFHMAVPLVDKSGRFAGVLVQQIMEDDIAQKLTQYANNNDYFQLMTHHGSGDFSFVFPPPDTKQTPTQAFHDALTHKKIDHIESQGAIKANSQGLEDAEKLIMGFSKSAAYDIETYATYQVTKVQLAFLRGNASLLFFTAAGIVLGTLLFYYLYHLAMQLVRAQFESNQDELTRIYNRRALDDTLPKLVRDALRTGAPLSVLFIDIDHFRKFNETYGHESGDVALIAVATALQSCAQRPLDFVCRWGGEEFVVVLPRTPREAAMKIADDILSEVRGIELQDKNGKHPQITVSLGHVTSHPSNCLDREDLVDLADKAMMQAKHLGRNQRVEFGLDF